MFNDEREFLGNLWQFVSDKIVKDNKKIVISDGGRTEFLKLYIPVFICQCSPIYHNTMNDIRLMADTAYNFPCRRFFDHGKLRRLLGFIFRQADACSVDCCELLFP